MSMQIDLTMLDEARADGKTQIIKEVFCTAKLQITSGEKVTIIQNYSNAPADTIEVVSSLKRINELEASLLS